MTSSGKVAFGLTAVLVLQCLQAQNSSSTVGTSADLSGTTDGTTALNGATNGGSDLNGVTDGGSDLSGTTHGGTTQGPETSTTPATHTEMSNTTNRESQNNSTTTTITPSQSISQETSREPLTTAITPKLINLNKNISLPFTIRFLNANFSQELGDNTTQAYKIASETYHNILFDAYAVEPGFQDITIRKFREGSLIVEYTATFKFDAQPKNDLYLHLHTKLRNIFDRLKSIDGVDNVTLDRILQSNTLASLGDRLCGVMECPKGYSCQHDDNAIPHLLCVHKCRVSHLNCLNDGTCVLDTTFEPVCRCPTRDGFIYGGEKCEHKAEMLDMSKDNIIAIAAGAGGGVILIFLIIIMVLCCTRSSKAEKKEDKVKDDASEQSFKSMKDSEDGLHQAYNGKVNPAMSEPSFRRSDSKVSQQLRQEPYVVSSASLQPNSRNPRDIVDSYADYRYQGSRGPVEKMEMRRQSRVRVADDIEINPDYGRFSSSARPRDSVDIGSPYRKNPLFTVPANRRKSSVYMEIDDNDTKSVMYQPATNVDHPTRPGQATNTIDHPLRQGQQVKVYDYYNRKESVASTVYPRPRAASNADLYDFDEDNSPMRPVYGVRRIQQGPNSPRRF